MKQQEIIFHCYYCGGDVVYGEHCTHCDAKLEWEDIWMEYTDKYLEIFIVCVK